MGHAMTPQTSVKIYFSYRKTSIEQLCAESLDVSDFNKTTPWFAYTTLFDATEKS